jgi:acyl-CoA synthetase (AMP-forming)/AMP-acid ligase II
MTTLLLPTFAMGATMVLPASPKFDLASYLRLVTKYRATKLHIAPPVAIALRNTPLLDRTTTEGKEIDLSSVKVMLSGGAPTPTEVVKTIYNRTGIPLQLGYGATETGSVSQCEAHDFMNPLSLKELGSAGFAMSNNEVCIRPMEETTEEQTKTRFLEAVEQGKLKIKAGEYAAEEPSLPGEVCIRGPHIMLGYYSGLASDEGIGAKDEKLSSTAFTSDGYYRTGDEGVFDKQGRLWLIGRTKELIKVKGFQVPPVELDNLFAKHPETLDAAAAGIVEGDGGEQVVMYVVPKDQNVLTNLEHQVELVNRLSHYVTDKLAQ